MITENNCCGRGNNPINGACSNAAAYSYQRYHIWTHFGFILANWTIFILTLSLNGGNVCSCWRRRVPRHWALITLKHEQLRHYWTFSVNPFLCLFRVVALKQLTWRSVCSPRARTGDGDRCGGNGAQQRPGLRCGDPASGARSPTWRRSLGWPRESPGGLST